MFGLFSVVENTLYILLKTNVYEDLPITLTKHPFLPLEKLAAAANY